MFYVDEALKLPYKYSVFFVMHDNFTNSLYLLICLDSIFDSKRIFVPLNLSL